MQLLVMFNSCINLKQFGSTALAKQPCLSGNLPDMGVSHVKMHLLVLGRHAEHLCIVSSLQGWRCLHDV
jgi:hypothetical protein